MSSVSLPEGTMTRIEAATDQSKLHVTLEEVSHLSQEEREQLHSCLQEYADFLPRESQT